MTVTTSIVGSEDKVDIMTALGFQGQYRGPLLSTCINFSSQHGLVMAYPERNEIQHRRWNAEQPSAALEP